MGTLEQELKKIHDAGLGVAITWLCDWRVDVRLVDRNGVVAAEGEVEEVAHVLPWLEGVLGPARSGAISAGVGRRQRRQPRWRESPLARTR